MDKYNHLLHRLDKFIDKYYRIKFFKGLAISFLSIVILITSLSLIEHLGHYNSSIRLLIFLLFTVTNAVIGFVFLMVPLLRWLKILPRISYLKANKVLNTLLLGIDDKIVNILELHEQLDSSVDKDELLLASIIQKSNQLESFNFTEAISLKSLKYLLPYLVATLLIFSSLLLITPNVYLQGSKRIINYNKEYSKLFDYGIKYKTQLLIERNKDLKFSITINGKNNPEQFYVKINSSIYLMRKLSDSTFTYIFKNVNNNFVFNFYGDDFTSESIQVNIIDIPTITNFHALLNYPSYTRKESEEIDGIYDFKVPEGTDIQLTIRTNYADSGYIYFDKDRVLLQEINKVFTYKLNLSHNLTYCLGFNNKSIGDSIIVKNKFINAIKDEYPVIKIQFLRDKVFYDLMHYKVSINDDYGISSLWFHVDNDSLQLNFNTNISQQEIYFSHDFSVSADSIANCFFRVFDNDGYNGLKYTSTDKLKVHKENFSIKINNEKRLQKEFNKKFEETQILANELNEEVKSFQESLIKDNLQQWEKLDRLNSIKNKQLELDKLLQEVNSINKQKDLKFNNSDELSKEIMRKQELLSENLKNLMDNDLKELLDKLQKLMEEYNKSNLHDSSKELEYNYEQLSKELDKNLEKLQKLDIQNNIDLIAQELDKLSNNELQSSDSLSKPSFNKVEKEYKETIEKNNQLAEPLPLKSFEEEFKSINESYNKTDSEKKRSKEMKELSKQMNSMLTNSNEQQEGENADDLRLLLENIFYFSFEQEQLIEEFKYLNTTNPKFVELQAVQLTLRNDYKIIYDSLFQLSRRSDFIGNTITEHANGIQKKLEVVNLNIESRNRNSYLTNQQYILTHANDLILLLSESLKNMDQSSGSGSGQSSKRKQKPKSGEPSLSDLRKSQEDMKGELERMLQQMEEGKKSGQGKGKESFGQMLMQQEMFQNQINDILSQDGINDNLAKKLNDIKRLSDDNKRDIINMRIDNNFYHRQQNILTRLLEAENAEMERDKEEKREAEENTIERVSKSKKYFEQNNEKTNFNEIIKLDEIQLNQFYKELFNGYLNNVNAN